MREIEIANAIGQRKDIDDIVESAIKREMPFLDVRHLVSLKEDVEREIAILQDMNEIEFCKRVTPHHDLKSEIACLIWSREAYRDEIAFSQEWLDSRIAKPEFAKSRKRRAAMKAEKAKWHKKGEKRNA